MNKDLEQIAAVDLTGCATVAEMGNREGWTPDTYALVLSESIRDSRVPLDRQRERLQALAQVGAGLAGDQAAADELARHYSVLEALWHRFARTAHEISAEDPARGSVHSERYLNAALKAQRAAMACLSALKVLRDGNQPPTKAAHESIPAPAPALAVVDGVLMVAPDLSGQ
jgi:AcrR family transcriptional regulator